MSLRLGVDLGGTKIEIIALRSTSDASRPGHDELCERVRIPTPSTGYTEILRAIAGLVREVESRLGEQGTVGVGIPGVVSPATGLVKNANTTALNGHPLDRDLAQLLGREIRVANDANCFALSEARDGAGFSKDQLTTVFGVILGTGTGGGWVVGGRIVAGPDGIAGEWGHNSLPWPEPSEVPGPKCWCGRHGCIETFLSGPGLARDHQLRTSVAASAEEIARRAEQGDSDAEQTLVRYEGRLARALASIINVLNPDVIVLGGGLSNLARFYRNIPKSWSDFVFSDRVSTRLVTARHGDASGVRGAAWLWPHR